MLVSCKECGKDVSSTAKSCPHCGVANPRPIPPMSKGFKVFIGNLLGFLLLVVVIANLPEENSPVQVESTSQNETLDKCYVTGKSFAKASLANADKTADAGLSTSAVMREGCRREGETAADQKACERECVIGFRSAIGNLK